MHTADGAVGGVLPMRVWLQSLRASLGRDERASRRQLEFDREAAFGFCELGLNTITVLDVHR
jgi:hypothetical protein